MFGRLAAPIVFGWIVAGHQLGADSGTILADSLRSSPGSYTLSSILMGAACLIAAVMRRRIKGHRAGGELIAAAISR